jgi:hypothetical protein
LVGKFFTPDNQKSAMKKKYSTHIFITYGREWNSRRLSTLLKAWWGENMGLPIAMNLHRQFAVGMQREFVSYSQEDPRCAIVQHPFAHEETADEMNYARLHGTPSIPLSRQTLFEAISKDWLREFDFIDPKLYRESLWDGSNIYRLE